MKKIIMLFAVGISLATIARSQVRYGILGGFNISTLTGYSTANFPVSSIITLQSAFFALVPAGKKLVVKPSIGFSPKGIKFTNVSLTDNLGNDVGTGSLVQRFDYIQFTLPLQYKTMVSKNVTGYFGAGPYIGYAIAGKVKIKNFKSINGGTQPPGGTINFEDRRINRFDAGISLQITTVIKNRWLGAVSFDAGITKLYKDESVVHARNQCFGFSCGYIFK